MVSFQVLSTLLLLSSVVKSEDLPAIEVVGNKFYYVNNGSEFYIKGVAYQQDTANITSGETFVDPLADSDSCKRDIPYLSGLDTNTIRVYALNSSLDHSDCMSQLSDAGIYVIADLSEPSLSIDRSDPKWSVELYERYVSIVDEFADYTNVLGFIAGNEVTNDETNTDASAFVKAAIRDVKAYIKDQDYRDIPVGYSSNDDDTIRVPLADYFACGSEEERADFFGINMYEWCGDSTFETSGYEDRTKEFKNLTIPAFFSEYGCNKVTPREFTEVAALYSDDMTDVWSGGIVYLYFEEANNYGLVSVDGDSVSTLEDYNNLKSEIEKISPSSASVSSGASSTATLACPTQGKYWKAATSLPPTPDDGLCSCMEKSLECVVSDDVDSDDYADLFSTVCGDVTCDGINANGTTGVYGAYSFCSSKQQLSFVLNLYYQQQGGDSSACSFDGSATLNDDATTESTCSTALSEAGTAGTGTVSTVIGTASGSSSDDASSSDDSSSSDGSSSAGNASSTGASSSSGSSSSSSSTASSKSSSSSKSSGSAVQVPMIGQGLAAFTLAAVIVGMTALLV